MKWDEYLAAIRSDSELIAAAARKGLNAAVPACEGWTVRDVVTHTGLIHREKEETVRRRLTEDWDLEMEFPPDSELADWFAEGAESMLATLADTDPATPVWTWAEDQSVGFWYRRMAQETLIHRVDAEQAHGDVSPINAEIAVDGVDEILMEFLEGTPGSWATVERGEKVLELAVPEKSWFFRLDRWGGTTRSGRVFSDMPAWIAIEVQDGADCRVSGSAPDMDLWLWGRGPIDGLVIDGDTAMASELRQDAAENTQ